MSGDFRRRGDSSPTDSGVDTHEWEGPRMSLDPFNYGNDNAWAKKNGAEHKKSGPYKGRPLNNNVPNGAGPRRSPKNSPNLGPHKEIKKMPVQAASQFPARTNFLLEHLSSFTLKTFQDVQVPPQERLKQTKELLAKGNQWTKEMEMRLTDTDVVLLDGETQDVVEVFLLSTIGHIHHFSDDPDLNSVLVFNTMQTEDRFAAMHLFQCDRVPAAVVATEIMKASSSRAAMPNKFAAKGGVILPPPPTHPAPPPPKEVDQERLDLYEKSLVAQTIAAFSAVSETSTKRTTKPQVASKYLVSDSTSDIPDESLSAEISEGRTNRDVQILNHCIDDIENLVMQSKRSAEAWKKLQKKKGKKVDSLTIEARPPPEADFYDAFQKFKHSFNLLAKLKQHIHNPNASELVHYLFVPLSLLIRCTGGPVKAGAVLAPLLTPQAVDLLQNCMSSNETVVWRSLGPNWTMTKSSPHFKDQFIPPYTPVFKDGWVPPYVTPQVIAGKDVSNLNAAIAANAAAVAQLNDEHKKDPSIGANLANPAVLSAAAKFRRLTSVKKPEETAPTSPTKKGLRRVRVLYDFQARNSKELSVHQGEEVAVLLDSRQWWCIRNSDGAIGFVPNTIFEESVVLPSPPTAAPPPVPTVQVTSSSQPVMPKTVVTTVQSSAPAASLAPAPATTTTQARAPAAFVQENPQVPRVELRPVGMAKPNRPVSAPPTQFVMHPPPPPSSSPPDTPPPPRSPPPSVIIINNGTVQKEKGATLPVGTDLAKAIQAKNLKRVDPEAEKKRREQAPQTRLSSTDMINDELKRRMTSSLGGLTPRSQRKESQPAVHLTAESDPPEVKEWLKSKGFSHRSVTALSGKTAKDLELMTKDQLKQLCGDAEGPRVFSQFAVQKANWKVTRKGSELAFIMNRRKARLDDTGEKVPEISGELRGIVADAKKAAAKEEVEIIGGSSNAGYTSRKISAPQPKPRPNSFAGPDTKPRSDSNISQNLSQGESFEKEFIPPPPMLFVEAQSASDEDRPRARKVSAEEVEKIAREQKKQQDFMLEHNQQLYLLEQLQRQKLELEMHKLEFEEQQKRQKQAELQDQQRELQRQIQGQQDQLKVNQDKLVQQQRFLTSYETVSPQITYTPVPQVMPQMSVMPQMPGVMSQMPGVMSQMPGVMPQMPGVMSQMPGVMPQVPGMMPAGSPTYLPMGGIQPMYTPYTTAMATPAGVTHMMPTIRVPTVSTMQPPM